MKQPPQPLHIHHPCGSPLSGTCSLVLSHSLEQNIWVNIWPNVTIFMLYIYNLSHLCSCNVDSVVQISYNLGCFLMPCIFNCSNTFLIFNQSAFYLVHLRIYIVNVFDCHSNRVKLNSIRQLLTVVWIFLSC